VNGLLVWLESFCTLKLAGFNNIQVVAIVTLVDNNLTGLLLDPLHGAEDDLELVRVQVAEHKGLAEAISQRGRQLCRLLVEGCLELLFLVPVAEGFGTDGGARSPLGSLLLDLFYRQVKHVVVAIATL